MLRLWMITSSLFVASFGIDVNFTSDKTCYSSGENMKLTAEYSGSGTVTAVEWYYSNRTASNLLVLAINCQIGGAIDAGYPDTSRMSFTCSTNKFTLTLTGLKNDEFDKSWGATFSLSVGASPDVVQSVITSCDNCKCECDCECRTIVIVSIVFGIFGALGLLIIVVGIPAGCFNERETLLLASGVIGIVFDVLTLVLSIVVKVKECCECCEENCEDSECCAEDSECCKDWIDNAAIAFIVIPCLAVVASVIIFVLVKLDIITPGNDGGNGFFCFNNGNDDGNDGGNDSGNNGHHRGRGTNSSTVHTERADTHRGTLSDRANSDGEVSRKDVHFQENRDNFSGRPMPPIPLTDKKGRGLSANYDDDHPMITVGIPDKRAGDLGPLDEEPRKKKKKKRKQVNDDDDE